MKRAFCVWFVITAIASGTWAQSSRGSLQNLLDPLQGDLENLLSSIGQDIAPELLQTTLAGDIVGEAAFKGDFPHCSITFPIPAVGVSLGNGIATVLNDSSYPWEFVLHVNDLVNDNLPETGTTRDLYQASRQVFPYPSFAFGFGFSPFRDIEVLTSGFYLPQALSDKLIGLASSSTIDDLAPEFSTASVLVKVRKVFFRDQHGFPAMSFGLGGFYSNLNLGATVDVAKLNDGEGIDIGSGTLNLNGTVGSKTSLYGGGMEFAISKHLLFLTPFAKVGVWYRHASVSSTLDLDATITPTDAGSTGGEQRIQTSTEAIDEGIDAQVCAGLELRLFFLIVHLQANLYLEDPLVDIGALSLTDIAAKGLSANLGIRLAF
jgi:hypothetical protein